MTLKPKYVVSIILVLLLAFILIDVLTFEVVDPYIESQNTTPNQNKSDSETQGPTDLKSLPASSVEPVKSTTKDQTVSTAPSNQLAPPVATATADSVTQDHSVISDKSRTCILKGMVYREKDPDKSKAKAWGQQDPTLVLHSLKTKTPNQSLKAVISSDGSYAFADIPPGTYALALPQKFYVQQIDINNDQELDIYLPTSQIMGKAHERESMEPALDVQVVVQRASDLDVPEGLKQFLPKRHLSDRQLVNNKGEYRFENLPPGKYSLFANGGGYGASGKNVELEEKDILTVDFPLTKDATGNFVIQDENGKDIEDVQIFAGGITWGFAGAAGGMKAGKASVLVVSPDREFGFKEVVDFKAGETTTVKFVLKPAVLTTIYFVNDEDDRPVPEVDCNVMVGTLDAQATSAFVYTQKGLKGRSFVKSNDKGQVEVCILPAGAYLLKASCNGYQAVEQNIEIVEGIKEIVIRLKKIP